MSCQKKIHFIKFLVYDPTSVGFWAIVPVANFRGAEDSENMTLSNIEGQYAQNKPSELLGILEGLISILNVPTPENVRPSPKILLNTQQDTQDLLARCRLPRRRLPRSPPLRLHRNRQDRREVGPRPAERPPARNIPNSTPRRLSS